MSCLLDFSRSDFLFLYISVWLPLCRRGRFHDTMMPRVWVICSTLEESRQHFLGIYSGSLMVWISTVFGQRSMEFGEMV